VRVSDAIQDTTRDVMNDKMGDMTRKVCFDRDLPLSPCLYHPASLTLSLSSCLARAYGHHSLI